MGILFLYEDPKKSVFATLDFDYSSTVHTNDRAYLVHDHIAAEVHSAG